jgi:hypothetical protein
MNQQLSLDGVREARLRAPCPAPQPHMRLRLHYNRGPGERSIAVRDTSLLSGTDGLAHLKSQPVGDPLSTVNFQGKNGRNGEEK